MDLSRIETLTREMLEVEARRRGIKSPEFRTRTELVRLILRHQYGGQLEASRERIEQGVSRARLARDLVGTALSAALDALPDSLGFLGRLTGKQALPRHPPAPPTPPQYEAAQRNPVKHNPVQHNPVQHNPAQPAPKADAPAQARAPYSPPVSTVSDEKQAAPIAAPAVTTLETAPLPPAGAPAPSRPPTTRTFEEEPIRTRSMAQLLAAQGHRERALAIYEELIAQRETHDGGDRELDREIAAVRRGEPVAGITLPSPREPRYAGPSHDRMLSIDAALPNAGDERLECEGKPHTGLLLRWTITDEGARRARAVLGVSEGDAELTLRLVAIRPDAEKVIRSEITEHGPVPASGEWLAGPLDDVARCVASIGLRSGNRFVSIAHARA